MMQLPTIYGITPSVTDDAEAFFLKLDSRLKKGLRLIQVRQPKMSQTEFESFTKQVLAACKKYDDVRVLVNTDPERALQMGAHGVHLSSSQLKQLPEESLGNDFLISASCHNEQELKKAELIDADFVVLSPVKHTKSHLDTSPLGWRKFKKMVIACNLPVFALGGMSQDDVKEAQLAGAVGVSILSGLWD